MSRQADHRKRSSVSSLASTDSMYIYPYNWFSLSDSSSFLDPLPPRLYSNDNDIFPSLYEDTDEFRRRCDSVENFISAQSPGALFNSFQIEEMDYFTLEQRNRSQSLNTTNREYNNNIPIQYEDIPTQLPDFRYGNNVGYRDENVRFRSQSFSHSSNYSQFPPPPPPSLPSPPSMSISLSQIQLQQLQQQQQQQQPPQLIPYSSSISSSLSSSSSSQIQISPTPTLTPPPSVIIPLSSSTNTNSTNPSLPIPPLSPLSIATQSIQSPPPPQLIQNNNNNNSNNNNIELLSLPSQTQSNQCNYYPNNNLTTESLNRKGERERASTATATIIERAHINSSGSIGNMILSRSMSRDSNYSIESCNSRRTTRSYSLELPLSTHENFNELIKDQNGCRYLQKKIDEDPVTNSEIIYENIRTKINDLLKDQFGNYLFQKLYENLRLEYRIEIVESIKDQILELSINPYGTRGIQKIITVDYNCDNIIEIILSIILDNLDTIATDSNGNHIIQISLKYFNNKNKNILIDKIISLEHLIFISKAKHGSSVIQLSFIYCNEIQHNIFIKNIINNILPLIKDQFGNYIIQYILEHGNVNDKKLIIRKLSGRYYELSRNKVSSNVIEKCVRFCFNNNNNNINNNNESESVVEVNESGVNDNNEIFNMIIDELISNSNFHVLLTDKYANYVIQSALCSDNKCVLDKLHDAIIPYKKEMKTTSGGRKILSKINKLYKKNT